MTAACACAPKARARTGSRRSASTASIARAVDETTMASLPSQSEST